MPGSASMMRKLETEVQDTAISRSRAMAGRGHTHTSQLPNVVTVASVSSHSVVTV